MSYKLVEGRKMDGQLLELADAAVQGAGDGRISQKDAEGLFNTLFKEREYTESRKDTVDYLYRNYTWTDKAREWFKHELKLWLDHKVKAVLTPEDISKARFGSEDVLKGKEERNERDHDLRAATAETYQDHEEIAIIVRLANGDRVEVISNFVELEGDFVQLRGGYMIPVRAIESVEI